MPCGKVNNGAGQVEAGQVGEHHKPPSLAFGIHANRMGPGRAKIKSDCAEYSFIQHIRDEERRPSAFD